MENLPLEIRKRIYRKFILLQVEYKSIYIEEMKLFGKTDDNLKPSEIKIMSMFLSVLLFY